MGQKSAFEFTFTAVDSASHVHLDSVKIMNRTQGNKHIIFWPDTTISLELALGDTLLYVGYATFDPVGINDRLQEDEDFRLFQNYPNPVIDQSTVAMFIPGNGMLQISVSDVQGSIIFRKFFQIFSWF